MVDIEKADPPTDPPPTSVSTYTPPAVDTAAEVALWRDRVEQVKAKLAEVEANHAVTVEAARVKPELGKHIYIEEHADAREMPEAYEGLAQLRSFKKDGRNYEHVAERDGVWVYRSM